jgi:hypothetical protein
VAGSWARTRVATTVALALGIAAGAGAAAGTHAQAPGLEGSWEYRQANPGRPYGVDAEGERLVIARSTRGELTAQYFGLERTGEHGLYYTAVEARVTSVADHVIRVVVPERTLLRTRPRSLEHARTLESAGVTRDPLTFHASLVSDGRLLATCTAAAGACPARELVFHRMIRTR